MNEFEYWKLHIRLNIVQAALLLCNQDPANYQDNVEIEIAEKQPEGYYACKTAILDALENAEIDGHLSTAIFGLDEAHPVEEVSLFRSYVKVESLKEWLRMKSFRSGFFFPAGRGEQEYRDKSHPHYAPKLVAAVAAWQAVSASITTAASPKQQIASWLRANASYYDLTDTNGKPNETAIQEISKVVNWNLKGGAPKTPGND